MATQRIHPSFYRQTVCFIGGTPCKVHAHSASIGCSEGQSNSPRPWNGQWQGKPLGPTYLQASPVCQAKRATLLVQSLRHKGYVTVCKELIRQFPKWKGTASPSPSHVTIRKRMQSKVIDRLKKSKRGLPHRTTTIWLVLPQITRSPRTLL